MIKRKINLAFLIFGLSACSSVTITPEGHEKLVNKPTYEESKPFYLWGTVGEHHVDVMKICNGKEPLQMQSQETFTDGLVTFFTIGIYAPHTAKVWCDKEES